MLVQPVAGTNLLFVLDPEKRGRCVASSKLARSDPTCLDDVKPILNRGLDIGYLVLLIAFSLQSRHATEKWAAVGHVGIEKQSISSIRSSLNDYNASSQ